MSQTFNKVGQKQIRLTLENRRLMDDAGNRFPIIATLSYAKLANLLIADALKHLKYGPIVKVKSKKGKQ